MRLAAIPDLGLGTLSTIDMHEQDEDGVEYLVDATGDFYVLTRAGLECQLERQDQLQEMVIGTKHTHLLAHEFALWWHGGEELGRQHAGHVSPNGCDASMEQLWLAFVMKEKYHKIWTGEEWIETLTNKSDI